MTKMCVFGRPRTGLILEWALFSNNMMCSASANNVPLQDYQNEYPDKSAFK